MGRVLYFVSCGRCFVFMLFFSVDVFGLRRVVLFIRFGRILGVGREGCGGYFRIDFLVVCVFFFLSFRL